MVKSVLFDQIHVTVYILLGLPPADYDKLRRTLNGRRFLGRLRRAVQIVFRRDPVLSGVRLTFSR
jgi:hypothetical protein